MSPILFILIGAICLVIVVAVFWRLSSNRTSIPCPSWLGWLIELDNPFLRSNRASEIISHLELHPGMKVLDFGSGPGRLTIPVARQIQLSGSVTAYDIQPAMLERVRAKAVREDLNNIDFVQGTSGEGKLGNTQYDRALLVTVLGEIPDKETLLKEIFNSLKPNGWLSVTEAIADPHFQTRAKVMGLAKNAGFKGKGFFGNAIAYTAIFEKPCERTAKQYQGRGFYDEL